GSEHASGAIAPIWPMEGPREPGDCGPNGDKCPLANWMRLVVAPAASTLTGSVPSQSSLAQALERVAAYAPENEGFVAAARHAALVANTGDARAVRAACADCHTKYKAMWRAHHRTRAPQ